MVAKPGRLKASHILNVVAPIFTGGGESDKEALAKLVLNVLKVCVGLKATTIAMPAISSGMMGFPKAIQADIMLRTIFEFIQDQDHQFKEIRIVNFDSPTCKIFS